MEALIHHFKLWTEGFPAPDGSVYQAVESPRGELGVLLAGDGGAKPRRCHWRTPSFDNLSVIMNTKWVAISNDNPELSIFVQHDPGTSRP